MISCISSLRFLPSLSSSPLDDDDLLAAVLPLDLPEGVVLGLDVSPLGEEEAVEAERVPLGRQLLRRPRGPRQAAAAVVRAVLDHHPVERVETAVAGGRGQLLGDESRRGPEVGGALPGVVVLPGGREQGFSRHVPRGRTVPVALEPLQEILGRRVFKVGLLVVVFKET